jgi:hypothetical protein
VNQNGDAPEQQAAATAEVGRTTVVWKLCISLSAILLNIMPDVPLSKTAKTMGYFRPAGGVCLQFC